MTTGHGPAMNLLWSYAYARTFNMADFLGGLGVPRLRFFADSGAHSARTLGITIGIDDYADWIKRWSPWFTVYCNLDVIGAPEATWRNQRHLEDEHGLAPMPVFHTGEPWTALERYLDEGYTYIALGKLLGNAPGVLRPWLARAFHMAQDRAVFHGFGMTTWRLLKEFPFYSVDSSSWGAGVRYGMVRLFHHGRWVNVRLRSRDDVRQHRETLAAYGIPLSTLTRGGYDRNVVAGACAVAVYRASAWLRARHGPIELPEGKGYPTGQRADLVLPPDEPGQHTYLAEGSTVGHQRHAGGLHLYLADASSKWTAAAASRIAREDQ